MKISSWYKNLKPGQKLAFYFLSTFIFWFSLQLFWRFIDDGDDKSRFIMAKMISRSICTTIALTFFLKWHLVKQTFQKNKPAENVTE